MTEFKIKPLPPNIDCESIKILKALNKASRALGQLKGEVSKIPNYHILIDTLILQEAKDSNEIENIVTTDDEMYKAAIDSNVNSQSAKEAVTYAKAIKMAFEMVEDRQVISFNDLKKVQTIIAPNHPIRKVPGTVLKNPRTEEVVYTPPQDFNLIQQLIQNLESYMNENEMHDIDSLIKMPIIHFQFESIHPFYDGNGRTGRLLNIIYLIKEKLLTIPILYLSSYIIKNKNSYYQLLQEVRTDNKWEEWIVWMLKGVEETSKETIRTVNEIKVLMDYYKKEIRSNFSFYSHDLINILFKHPYTKNSFLEKELNVHRNTASSYLNELAKAGLLTKIKVGKFNYYINERLMDILKRV